MRNLQQAAYNYNRYHALVLRQTQDKFHELARRRRKISEIVRSVGRQYTPIRGTKKKNW
jgi:hypothetical protein